jgi:hypothetical protein
LAKALAYVLFALGLAYACVWWSYEQFYGHFKVSPQDIGLSPTGNIADFSSAALQLGIWLLVLILVLALIPTISFAAFLAVDWKDKERLPWLLLLGVAFFELSVVLYEYFVETWPGPVLIVYRDARRRPGSTRLVKETSRIPAGDAIVTIRNAAKPCAGVH